MKDNFVFPPVKFAKVNTASEQLTHLFSEVKEAFEEIEKGNIETALLEVVDIIHSFETLYRIAPARTDDLILTTIQKNSARGYYEYFSTSDLEDIKKRGVSDGWS
jgi:hypothetical protein